MRRCWSGGMPSLSWILAFTFSTSVFDAVAQLDLERDGLAREGFDEDLHATAQAEHQV